MDQSLTLLVDAPSLFYRALFSTPDSIVGPQGKPINAAHGFFRMFARLVADHDPDYIACASDQDWRPEWRVKLVDTYKSHRAAPGSQQEQAEARLAHQVPVIYALLDLCRVAVVGHPGSEAEDVIGTLAERASGRVAIFSGDRDLFQLVRDPKCWVLYPIRGVSEVAVVDEAYIEDRFGIPGRSYADYAILRGDSSDGLPGVRGIGEKSASALLSRYRNLDGVVDAAKGQGQGVVINKIRKGLDYIDRARQVVAIPRDLPVEEVDTTRPRELPTDEIVAAAAAVGLEGPMADVIASLTGTPRRSRSSPPN